MKDLLVGKPETDKTVDNLPNETALKYCEKFWHYNSRKKKSQKKLRAKKGEAGTRKM